MRKKHLIFFRHGETDWNRQGIVQGHSQNPLNDTGRQQAHALGAALKGKNLEVIVSSDLRRTHETAEIVNSYLSVPLHTTPALREVHAGSAQGTPRIEHMQTTFWTYWTNDHPDYDHAGYAGGETKGEAKKRAVEWIENFVATTEHNRIGICSHGTVMRLMIIALTGQVIRFANCDYVELNYHVQTNAWCIKDVSTVRWNMY